MCMQIQDSWHADVKSEYLECGTALDYTPLMVASECGHTEVARMLEAKGCSMVAVNSSGKSAKMLAEELRREIDWASVQPWDHSNILHLSAENLEAHLDRHKACSREHTHTHTLMHTCAHNTCMPAHTAQVHRSCMCRRMAVEFQARCAPLLEGADGHTRGQGQGAAQEQLQYRCAFQTACLCACTNAFLYAAALYRLLDRPSDHVWRGTPSFDGGSTREYFCFPDSKILGGRAL